MKTIRRLATVALAAAVCSTTALAQDTRGGNSNKLDGRNIDDSDITNAIDYRLMMDPAVLSYNVDVKTEGGDVTLTGTVDNLLAREEAADIARNVKGVKRVSNEIKVMPVHDRSDNQIRNDVEAALLSDPAVSLFDVDASVEDNTVTLTGTVASYAERQLAGRVAESVRGVTALANRIEVEYEASRTDAEIAADIRGLLKADNRIDAGLINVAVDDGRVKLGGTVGSAAERHHAMVEAWAVAGVKGTDVSELNVSHWWDRGELHDTDRDEPTDASIRSDIIGAFRFDPRVKSHNPMVAVRDGVVTLSGTVNDYQARRAAEYVAEGIRGVHRVKNLLKVRPDPRLTDEEIEIAATNALRRDPYSYLHKVNISAFDGTVALTGTVNTNFEKTHAESVVTAVNGVVDVNNYLNVDNDTVYNYDYDTYSTTYSSKSDAEVREEILDEMFWSPFVDSKRVTVTVDSGTATLAGTVESISEENAAVENAYEGGAYSVVNKLKIDPSLP